MQTKSLQFQLPARRIGRKLYDSDEITMRYNS